MCESVPFVELKLNVTCQGSESIISHIIIISQVDYAGIILRIIVAVIIILE